MSIVHLSHLQVILKVPCGFLLSSFKSLALIRIDIYWEFLHKFSFKVLDMFGLKL